ncbi:MAG: ABC transporter permease [Thiotrichales bacterium]|nr:ABC transporter permease [Thiotrichales bacterium]|tara:strand:+ start:105 stop:1073 length:969 start_codon:yes stop_codon:yes gene_type:complete
MMLRMVLRRMGVGLVVLWVVSLVIFAGTEILPGDVAEIMLGMEATPESLKALRRELGLDRPAYARYFEWLGDMATADLGMSLAGRGNGGGGTTIEVLIGHRLNNTLLLGTIVAAISIPLAVVMGLLAAMFPSSLYDRVVTFGTLCLVAVPEFFIATMLVLIFAVYLRWLPAIAVMGDFESIWHMLRQLAMPILTLCFVMLAQIARMTRAAVLNVMSSPYIEMAILKGVPRKRIILRHALSNAIGPIANIIALNLAYLVSGVVIVETIFAFPGLAKLMVDGVQTRDMPLVQACGMIFCATYVVLILLADICSIVSNPRLRHPK